MNRDIRIIIRISDYDLLLHQCITTQVHAMYASIFAVSLIRQLQLKCHCNERIDFVYYICFKSIYSENSEMAMSPVNNPKYSDTMFQHQGDL